MSSSILRCKLLKGTDGLYHSMTDDCYKAVGWGSLLFTQIVYENEDSLLVFVYL